jgi:hypothetical protein
MLLGGGACLFFSPLFHATHTGEERRQGCMGQQEGAVRSRLHHPSSFHPLHPTQRYPQQPSDLGVGGHTIRRSCLRRMQFALRFYAVYHPTPHTSHPTSYTPLPTKFCRGWDERFHSGMGQSIPSPLPYPTPASGRCTHTNASSYKPRSAFYSRTCPLSCPSSFLSQHARVL